MEARPRTSKEPDNRHDDQPATENPDTDAARGDAFDTARFSRRQRLLDAKDGKAAWINVKWEPGYTIRLLHKVVHIKVSFKEGYMLDPKTRESPDAPEIPSVSLQQMAIFVGYVRQSLHVCLLKQRR